MGWEVVFGDALILIFHVPKYHRRWATAYIHTDVINIPYIIGFVLICDCDF